MPLLTREIIEQIDTTGILCVEVLNKNDYDEKNLHEDIYDTIIYYEDDMFVYDEGFGIVTICSYEPVELSDTSYVYDEEFGENIAIGLFQDTDFSSILLDNVDTSKVSDMSYMFWECKAHRIDLSGFDTTNVIYMNGMFSEIDCLELDLSGFNTSKVKNMSGMFSYSSIKKLNLDGFCTSKVENMSWMFARCQSILVDLSSFDISNVTDMRCMFQDGTIGFVNLQSFKSSMESQVTGMFSRFEGDIETADTLIEEAYESESIREVEQSEKGLLTRELVKVIDSEKNLTFKSNVELEKVIAKAQLMGLGYRRISKDFLVFEKGDTICLLSNKEIYLVDTQVVDYSSKGLFSNTHFLSIDFHNTNTSNVTDMSSMFSYCKAKTIDLSSFDISNVTDMDFMFSYCEADAINISSFNSSEVTSMQSMFEYCHATIECQDERIMREYKNRKEYQIGEINYVYI